MCLQESLYRLREASETTISELETPHLYFSTPDAYKDVNDANILGFIESDESVHKVFDQFLNDKGIAHLVERLRSIGICCFTTEIPKGKAKSNFLNWRKPICIEYDSAVVENIFTNNTDGIIPFHVGPISYHKEPLIFDKEDNSSWHILWEENDSVVVYKSLKSINIFNKEFDELIKKMFTRLSQKYSYQKEIRFISRPLTQIGNNVKGYRLNIPEQAIKKVLIDKSIGSDDEFVKKISTIPHIKDKIVFEW